MSGLEGWNPGPDGRGSLDIIFSCLAALSLCSWSVLCVNIPPPGTSFAAKQCRKLWLTFITLLGPEFTLVIAMGQWHAARKTLHEFNRHCWAPWSLRHSFCAEMGFWVARTTDGVRFPLNGKALVYLLKAGLVHEQDAKEKVFIDQEQINDLNKSDSFARALAACQGGWLVINSIARWTQGLPITTLELTVLGFFVPNLGILYFWARKPSDVSISLTLRLTITVADIKSHALHNGYSHTSHDWYETPLDFVSRQEWHGSLIYSYWVNTPPSRLLKRLRFRTPCQKLGQPIASILNLSLPPLPLWLEFIEAAFAAVFLGINFIAWNWHFPTYVELVLWRLAVTALAFTFGIGCAVHATTSVLRPLAHAQMEMRRQRDWSSKIINNDKIKRVEHAALTMGDLFRRWRLRWAVRLCNKSPQDDPNLDIPLRLLLPGMPLMALYVFCRIAIFVEDGMAFRAQPKGTYDTVQWAKFLPNFS